MPTPRSLTTAPHRDFELEVVEGTWPDDISGEMVFSSPQHCTTMDYGIFDWGAICRLALEPGTRGAGAGRFAWQTRSIQSPGKRLWDKLPAQFSTSVTGYQSALGAANASNTAPSPLGRSPLHHLGCRAARRAPPRDAGVRRRGRSP